MWRYEAKSDEEYIGNVWGWKFSLFGLVLILGLVIAAAAVAHSRGVNLLDGNEVMPASEEVSTSPAQ